VCSTYHRSSFSTTYHAASGQSKGEALVLLAAATDVDSAVASLHRKYIGSRFIEVFRASSSKLCFAHENASIIFKNASAPSLCQASLLRC
jgi:hypothetical protein